MKITDLIDKKSINLNLKSNTKLYVIDELVNLIDNSGNLNNKEEYKKAILDREVLSTTGIGEGIAIPHAKTKAVNKASLAVGVSKDGIDYEAFDGSLAHLFFMIAAPDGANDTHLQVLARLSTILMDEEFRKKLINTSSKEEFIELINEKEKEKFKEEYEEEAQLENDVKEKYPKVLAVTACPTGIAHTFMAAESLNKTANIKGVSIKVETNGSSGAKNVLTKEEIEHANCIIVAADKNVEMARFNGKKVIITKVANGIHKADELIDRAVRGDAPIYHNSRDDDTSNKEYLEDEGDLRKVYKNLMNGVSNMLPFVVAGGILIALSFLFDNYSLDPTNFGKNTPIADFFNTIGNYAFGFMLPVLAGYIAFSIADRPAMVVGFVGGLITKEGGAGFLGALIAGFLAGYIVVGLKMLFSNLHQALEGIKPVLLFPLLGTLLISILMVYIIMPPVVAINNVMNSFLMGLGGSSKILLGIVVAAMMAVDMGGPVNKAAYVFGIAALEAGQYEVMAAVMAGGMVPPIAIAIATTFFKNRFTDEERKSGIVNYVMGLSFITEGAIPFAAADPIHVIPACVVGSGVAGALSMVFGAQLRAPHGGIFVLPVISNPFGYLIAIIAGSLTGMLFLSVLKKPIEK